MPSRPPASPATKDAVASATSLVRATSMPAAAAARSSPRTAKNRRPVRPAAMQATAQPLRTSTTSTVSPKGSRAISLPRRIARSTPKSRGAGIISPDCEANDGFLNTRLSSATAPAMLTIVSWAPRMRSAGAPMSTPTTLATTAASSRLTGNGMPVPNFAIAKPPTPATAACANESCPV